jgi:gp16 family phage-associated protein
VPSHSPFIDQITTDALVEARLRFFLDGQSVADWARTHGFNVQITYSVLNGRLRARRGEAHKIAVALGLKPVRVKATAETSAATPTQEAVMK